MNDISAFLQTVIIDAPLIFINLWSLIHLAAGYVLWRKFKLKFSTTLLILVGYEIVESFFPSLFLGETLTDQFWDVMVGMFGYVIAKKKKR